MVNRSKKKNYLYRTFEKKLKVKPFFSIVPKSINNRLYNPEINNNHFEIKNFNRSTSYTYPSFIIKKSFEAILDDNTTIPPDTMGAVGNGYVITMLNNEIKIQDTYGKSYGKVPLEDFWDDVSYDISDPNIIFDFFTKRWIAIAVADYETPFSKILVAISKTSNPLQYWDKFYFYTNDSGTSFADYPRVGLNSKWIAITAKMFSLDGNYYIGSKVWVLDIKNYIENNELEYKEFPVDFDNISGTLVPAVTYDAGEANLYIVDDDNYHDSLGYPLIQLSEITGFAYNPQLKPVPDTNGPYPGTGLFYPHINFSYKLIKAYQKGTTELIDTDDPNIINSVFINGKLWFTHSGGLPATGTPNRTAVFWYEVDPKLLDITGDPIVQSGVVDPGVGGCVFFPSIAVNKYNDVVIGFSRSDNTRYAEAAFVSRSSWDPPGTMSEIKTIKEGEAPYRKQAAPEEMESGLTGGIRWGDYSATVIDPSDNTTFWTIQEYAATPFSSGTPNDDRWGTWWAEITPLFSDIHGQYSWAEQSIIDIYTHHITTGYPDGTFKPGNYVTRGQMAAFIARAMKLNIPDKCVNPPFNDVPVNEWYCPYVEAIKDAGVTQGTSNGYYDPEGYVTRAQMAAFLSKALDLDTHPCTSKPFSDVSTDTWYCSYVQAIKDAHITTGYSDGTYRPYNYVTRAEMAVFLERAFLNNR